MERSFLKALGLNPEQIDSVMAEYGREKTDADKEIEQLKEQIGSIEATKNELKAYQKGGEKYIDPEEVKELKAFKESTQAAERTKRQKDSANELFKMYSDSNRKLLTEIYHGRIELDENGKVTNGADVMKDVKERFSDLPIETGNGGTQSGAQDYTGGGSGRVRQVY